VVPPQSSPTTNRKDEPVSPTRIDVHGHFLSPHYRATLAHNGHAQPDGFPIMPDFQGPDILAAMDELEISSMMLSVSSPGVSFVDTDASVQLARHVNDAAAQLVNDHPRRFGLIASLPLLDVDRALSEMARALDDLGADGIALPTNAGGRHLSDPEFAEVWQELDHRGTVAVLHPMSPPAWEQTSLGYPRPMLEFFFETTRVVVALTLSGTLARHRNLKLVVPHAGAAISVVAARVGAIAAVLAGDGEPADVPGTLARLYYDLAGYSTPTQLRSLLDVTTPGQLLYGSDMPFSPPANARRLIDELEQTDLLTEDERGAMFADNARRLFPRLSG
jgi:predicted TIM-barrel fold metal-dependent hydrolase